MHVPDRSLLDLTDAEVSLRPPDPAAIRAAELAPDVAPCVERWLSEALRSDTVRYFSVYLRAELVGEVCLHDIDRDAGESLVGYHLFRPELRGRGVGTRALALLQRYVMERTDLRRLVIITAADNHASRRIAEKNGFAYVGPPREDPTGLAFAWEATRPVGVASS